MTRGRAVGGGGGAHQFVEERAFNFLSGARAPGWTKRSKRLHGNQARARRSATQVALGFIVRRSYDSHRGSGCGRRSNQACMSTAETSMSQWCTTSRLRRHCFTCFLCLQPAAIRANAHPPILLALSAYALTHSPPTRPNSRSVSHLIWHCQHPHLIDPSPLTLSPGLAIYISSLHSIPSCCVIITAHSCFVQVVASRVATPVRTAPTLLSQTVPFHISIASPQFTIHLRSLSYNQVLPKANNKTPYTRHLNLRLSSLAFTSLPIRSHRFYNLFMHTVPPCCDDCSSPLFLKENFAISTLLHNSSNSLPKSTAPARSSAQHVTNLPH